MIGPRRLRYTIQARREAPDARIDEIYGDLPERWPEICWRRSARAGWPSRRATSATRLGRPGRVGARRRAGPASIPGGWPAGSGWSSDRATKEPAELERVAAACAVADRALATLLPEIRPGVTERELAWRLEVLIRTGGAEALAFDVACLAGPEAALPHGSPGDRPVSRGAVLLFDFGAQVAGYRSDMTRTLFVGEPTERDLAIYELVHRAQPPRSSGIAAVGGRRAARCRPDLEADAASPATSSSAAGHGDHFGHGTGPRHRPRDPRAAQPRAAPGGRRPLPSPTVFSVEPGVYLDGEMGVRIEDLVQSMPRSAARAPDPVPARASSAPARLDPRAAMLRAWSPASVRSSDLTMVAIFAILRRDARHRCWCVVGVIVWIVPACRPRRARTPP